MLTINIDPVVLATLQQSFPTPRTAAAKALDKYKALHHVITTCFWVAHSDKEHKVALFIPGIRLGFSLGFWCIRFGISWHPVRDLTCVSQLTFSFVCQGRIQPSHPLRACAFFGGLGIGHLLGCGLLLGFVIKHCFNRTTDSFNKWTVHPKSVKPVMS